MNSVPPLMIGAALAFWGWQSDNVLVGLAAGIALETPRWIGVKIDLGVKEHSTIADLCTIGFVLLAVIIGANRGIAHGVLQSFIWLPIVLSPIVAAQLVSAERRIPLSAIFRYMRKLKRDNPAIADPMVDVGAVYVALVLVSAGVANQRGAGYYIGIVVGTTLLLYSARPRHSSLPAGMAMLALAAGVGHFAHIGLAEAQAQLVDWVMDLNLLRTVDPDPYRVRTEIGSLGRLKKYDAIVLRVYAKESEHDRVRLLHRGSYNTYSGRTWIARGAGMQTVDSEADNETWVLSDETPQWGVKIATRFDLGRALLALPAGTARIQSFPANAMSRNSLGTVHAVLAVDWAWYEARVGRGTPLYSAPTPEDLTVPLEEAAVFDGVASELGLRNLRPAAAVRRIGEYFSRFQYSLYRDKPVPAGRTALGDFMTATRAGHCEYFAAAATLLLRAAGIPARYATGFAVVERSLLENAYVVRTRHAHAWTRAFIDGRWRDVDMTPPDWSAAEEAEAPAWQGFMDLMRYLGFQWSQRGEFKAGDSWYLVLGALAIYLVWSVTRGRKILRKETIAAAARRRYPGEDSEFYAVEKTLALREPSETQAAWLKRIGREVSADKLVKVRDALGLHQRYRFDPEGLAPSERAKLRELCLALAPPKA